jgi:hypothetical protein
MLDVWKYVIATKTWTAMNTTSQPPGSSFTTNRQPAMIWNAKAHQIILHVPDNGKDYSVDPAPSAAWSTLTTAGASVPTCTLSGGGNCGVNAGIFEGYDPTTGSIIAIMQQDGNPTNINVWQGQVPVAPTITSSATLTVGTQNSAYTWTFTATGASPITWSITSGALPTGMSLNSGTGVLSGTPSVYGTFTFTVQAANGTSPNATQNASLTINPVCLITTTTMPSGKFGIPYSQGISTAGCSSPTFSVVSGAAALATFSLSLNTSTGVISGSPTVTGICSFTLGATDANGNPTKALSITVVPGPGVFGVATTTGVTRR